jgi:uncharacterized protein (DUF1330 family)
MPAYVFGNIKVDEPIAYQQYVQMVGATVEKYGGRYLARGGRVEVLEGDLQPGRTIIIEFPSFEDAQRWHASPEYGAAKAVRQRWACGELVLVDGV